MQTSTSSPAELSPEPVNQPTPHALPNLYCTVDEFAEQLQVSRGTVFHWIASGLPSLRVGRCRRIIVERAFRWLEAGGADRTRRSPRAKRAATGSGSTSSRQ
jgi:excisionase family DNA binding protein